MERLKRYNKKILALMSAFIVLVGGIFSTSFQSYAANVAYNSVYAEPELDGNSGYLLTHTTPNGVGKLTIYYWKITPSTGNTVNPRMDIIINSSNISFTPLCDGDGSGVVGRAYVVLYRMDDDGSITRVHNSLFDASQNFYVSTTVPHASSVFGNYGSVANTVHGSTVPSVTVTWGGTVNNYNLIADVYNSVMNIYHQSVGTNARLDEMIRQLNILTSEIDNVEETLNSMYSLMSQYYDSFDSHLQNIYNRLGEQLDEQKKSNTWLEKIWNSFQEFLGMQGEESTEELEGKEESEELTEKEDELLNDDTLNTDDLELDLDTNSSGTIWSMVDRLVQSNEKVFTALISILTLGVVALILNR